MVAYTLTNSWPGGFQAQIVITDTGSTTINGWTLAWTFPGDQKISSLWNATYTQSGAAVSATGQSYNASISPNGSVTIGFTGTYTSSDYNPTAFKLNGSACSVVVP
jgi:cellulase/cellobiase CelA1